ncbi:MAG: hypothetical protein AAF962_02380 [Actinomycetota bacterium]
MAEQPGPMRRAFNRVVAGEILAAIGALLAAITPALVATADGTTLRGSVSAYWNVEPRYLFWLPFTAAAVLLTMDGVASFIDADRRRTGIRPYNVILGVALFVLTWWNVDEDRTIHTVAASVFFVLFIVVIVYTSLLAWLGVPVPGAGDYHTPDGAVRRAAEKAVGQVSLVYSALLALTLAVWLTGRISFYFFEVFALANFALFFVQGTLVRFPYVLFEFPWPVVNAFFRAIRVMAPRP